MSRYLRQSTASQTRTIGPFVDDTDFKTAEDGLTIANTDIRLKKNGAADVAKNSGGATADVNGCYAVTFDATDTDTVGELFYTVKVAGALQVFGSFMVLEEAVYDALFAASAPGYVAGATVDVIKWLGTAAATPTVAGVPEVDVTHLLGTAWLTPATAGTPDVNVKLIGGSATPVTNIGTVYDTDFAANYDTTGDCWMARLDNGVTHGGTTALLRLGSSSSTPAFYVTNSNGDAVQLESTGGNGNALELIGNGTADGLHAVGGATGKGAHFIGGATSGSGVLIAAGATNAIALELAAVGGVGVSLSAVNGVTTGNFLISGTLGATGIVTMTNASNDIRLGSTAYGAIADAVLDEDMTAHQTQGTMGQAIGDPGADSDSIWALLNTNLDATISSRASQTSVDTIDDFLDTEVAAILAAVDTEIGSLQTSVNGLLTTALTESYRADGATGSVAQLLYEINQSISDRSISGTTQTVNKIDGTTPALTHTLNSSSTPTSITRAT